MGNLQQREQERDLKTKKLATRVTPNAGELAYSCIPPFKITSLHSIMQKPTEFFTARTVWRPADEAKYVEVFKKLVAERKIACIGKINRKLEVELSDEGHAHLLEMDKKYTW